MATSAVNSYVSVGEYLGSVYRPDVDYVDGALEARNLGEFDHARLQKALLLLLAGQERLGEFLVWPELRVQVSPTRFRVPDLCLLRADHKVADIVREPPIVCVEILSPRDTVQRMRARCGDYLTMGVPVVWIFDPKTRTAYVLDASGMREVREEALGVEGTAVEVRVGEIFAPFGA